MMKKMLIGLLSALLILSGCTSNSIKEEPVVKDNEAFNVFLNEEFVETMEDDLMNLHYTIYDYSAMGIEKPEASLGHISNDAYAKMYENNTEVLNELKKFDLNTLSASQRVDYRVLEWSLNNSIACNQNPELDFYFRPSTGIQNNIVTNFMEYNFYNEESVVDYLALLKDIPNMFDEAISFTQAQIDKGLFMSDYTAMETIDGINRLFENPDNNQLIVSFNNKIDALEIDEQLKEEYKKENVDVVFGEVQESFNKVKNFLNENKKASKYNDLGLSDMPNGKEYYEALFKNKASTDLSVDEVFERLDNYLINQIISLQKIMSKDEELLYDMMGFEYDGDAVSILQDLEVGYNTFVPQMDEFIYELSYLDPTITDPNVSAYYVSGPIDRDDLDVIRVNADNNDDPLSLYITLAHEGLAGHMYQFNYYKNTKPRLIRNVLSFIGYSEGWAMYQELMALDLLDFSKPEIAELLKFDTRFSYVLQAMVDIGVNYYGWNADETLEFMAGYGYDDKEFASSIRKSVISEPLQIIPYGVGLYFFDSAMAEAKDTLGSKFDIHEYNKVILDNGPRPLDMVLEDIKAYINRG